MKHLKVQLSTWLTFPLRIWCEGISSNLLELFPLYLLTKVLGMKKSQNMLVWLTKMALAQHFCTRGKGWWKAQQSLKPAVNWQDSSVGPCGLLLVVSHVFAVPVLVLWVGLEKSKEPNLDMKNIFAGLQTWIPLEMLLAQAWKSYNCDWSKGPTACELWRIQKIYHLFN